MKVLIPILSLVLLMGCNESNELPKDQTVTQMFLESKGYQIVSYEGHSGYELTKEKIVTLPYMIYWGLQSVDPAEYLGRTIDVEKLIVKNHPLAKGKVDVYVYVVDGQPIGGTSYPHGDKSIGGYWSLEGKTLEELQPKPFQEWRTEWVNKYASSMGVKKEQLREYSRAVLS